MKVPVLSSLILFHVRQAGGGYHSLLSLNSVLLTRTYHSADCDTDHSMVASEVRLQPKQIHRSKTKGRLRLNTSNTSNSELCNRFTSLITEALNNCPTHSAAERWNHIREATYMCASEIFGKRERTSPDWFEVGRDEIAPAVNSKRSALLHYKRDSCEKTLTVLRKPEAIPKELPDNVRTDTGKTYVRTFNRQPIVETYGQCMKG